MCVSYIENLPYSLIILMIKLCKNFRILLGGRSGVCRKSVSRVTLVSEYRSSRIRDTSLVIVIIKPYKK